MQPLVLNVQINSLEALRRLYMPFITDGGLFIPSKASLPAMGDELFVTLSMPKLAFREAAMSRVIWLREHEESSRQRDCRGYGVQFLGQENPLRSQLESLLAARLNDSDFTSTM